MIGVVIAVRNQEEFIGEAIDSVLAQSFPASRIIVVDNASTDGTPEIARARGAEVVPGPDKGPAIARNIGARMLETEFISFLDGDDRYTPDRNRLLLEAIGEGAACQGLVREFYEPGREEELAARYEISPDPVHGSPLAMLVRRSAFEELGGLDQDEGASDLFRLMQRLGDVPEVDQVVLERRVHGSNRSIVDREEVNRGYLLSARAAILDMRRKADV